MRMSSTRLGLYLAVGAALGVTAWLVGPRLAIAAVIGVGVAGGLVVLTWLRQRLRALTADSARLRADLARAGTSLAAIRGEVTGTRGDVEQLSARIAPNSSPNLYEWLEKHHIAMMAAFAEGRQTYSNEVVSIEQRISGLEQQSGKAAGQLDCVASELGGLAERLIESERKELAALECRLKTLGDEAAAVERRLRVQTSGDLAAMEKRLNAAREREMAVLADRLGIRTCDHDPG